METKCSRLCCVTVGWLVVVGGLDGFAVWGSDDREKEAPIVNRMGEFPSVTNENIYRRRTFAMNFSAPDVTPSQ